MEHQRILGPGQSCPDGFWAGTEALSELLARRGIRSFRGDDGTERPCGLYFDDWYLYRIPEGTFGLYKMREQEQDGGDGDDPGMTVSFIAFDIQLLERACPESADALAREIHRVVAAPGQRHSQALRSYFVRPEAQGPYLMGRLYIQKLASLACGGFLPLPRCFRHASRRLCRALEGTGTVEAGKIRLADPAALTRREQLALLMSHTGDTSLHALAAEIRFHAVFLRPRLPGIYASAIRADMGVQGKEFLPVMPYYNEKSRWIKTQKAAVPDPWAAE